MKLRISKYLFLLMMLMLTLASCSENDETVGEYDNWLERNEQAFADTLSYARQQIANGNDDWKVIANWTLQNQTPNVDINGNKVNLSYKDADHIVVHVLKKGEGSGCPMYTDTVKVSYRGSYIPSMSYSKGYVFDKTFDGTYDKATAQLAKFAVKDMVDGFTTALLNMHIGDHWMVFIPYQLGYGASDYTASGSSNTIPGGSMLRFEIVMDSYYRIGQVVPGSRASKGKEQTGTWIVK